MTNVQTTGKLQWTKGDRLGKALKIANVSHAEMAQILGVSRNTIGNYIADRTPIRDGDIRNWAVRTGVSFDELKYGIPAPQGPNTRASGYNVGGSRLVRMSPEATITRLGSKQPQAA